MVFVQLGIVMGDHALAVAAIPERTADDSL